MKRFISVFMILGALMCVLYMGVAAEPNLDETTPSSSDLGTSVPDGEEGNESEDTLSVEISVEGSSSEETSDEDISSEEVSSEDASSETSSKYGYNATDPTIGNNQNAFGDPASDTSLEFVSKIEKDDGSEKNIFNLSKILKGLIFIPIVLALASIGALIYVNRKEFAGAKTKRTENSGSKARRKNNK